MIIQNISNGTRHSEVLFTFAKDASKKNKQVIK